MGNTKRILILTSSAGFGHKSAAKAIASALEEQFGEACQVSIADPLRTQQAPGIIRDAEENYDDNIDHPLWYRATYLLGNVFEYSSKLIEHALGMALAGSVRALLAQHEPDVVVAVHHDALPPLGAVLSSEHKRVPVLTVVTDLTTVHRRWFHDVSTMTVVPTQAAFDRGVTFGAAPDKLKIIGIPVNPQIARIEAMPEDIRRRLGWELDCVTLLVVGSERVSHLLESLRPLNHSALPLQFVLVAGGDDDLYQQFQAMTWHAPAHVFNFVDDMPSFLRACDIVMSKAGGLIVSESLAAGRPLLLVDVIQGQESGNADYVVEHRAGARASEPVEALETAYHWLDDHRKLLDEYTENAARVGRPRAAYEIAELAMQL